SERISLEPIAMTTVVRSLNNLSHFPPRFPLNRINNPWCSGLSRTEFVVFRILVDQSLQSGVFLDRQVLVVPKRIFDLLGQVVSDVLPPRLLEGGNHSLVEGRANCDPGIIVDVENLTFDSKLCHCGDLLWLSPCGASLIWTICMGASTPI